MLFGYNLTQIDERLVNNLKTTKAVFPQEIQLIESGFSVYASADYLYFSVLHKLI
jgi:hypothetical protein